jgi:hypothetical protein
MRWRSLGRGCGRCGRGDLFRGLRRARMQMSDARFVIRSVERRGDLASPAPIDLADFTSDVIRPDAPRARLIEVRDRRRLLGGLLSATEPRRYRNMAQSKRSVRIPLGLSSDDVLCVLPRVAAAAPGSVTNVDRPGIGVPRLVSMASAVMASPLTSVTCHEKHSPVQAVLLFRFRNQLRRLAGSNHPRGVAVVHRHAPTAETRGGCHRARVVRVHG